MRNKKRVLVVASGDAVVLETDPEIARRIGRPFVADPYLTLCNYTNNLRRYGYTDNDIAGGGSDHHVAIQVLTAGDDDPMPGYEQLARSLR